MSARINEDGIPFQVEGENEHGPWSLTVDIDGGVSITGRVPYTDAAREFWASIFAMAPGSAREALKARGDR